MKFRIGSDVLVGDRDGKDKGTCNRGGSWLKLQGILWDLWVVP